MTPGSMLSSLKGSIDLAQFDASALERFDLSPLGFWRSFSVVLFTVPLFCAAIYLQNTYLLVTGSSPEPYAPSIFIFLLDWIGFTVLMVPITSLLDVADRYKAAMTVYNWCRPVAIAFWIPVFAAGAAGLAESGTMFFLYYFTLTLRCVYLSYILHVTLRIGLGPILAIVLMDFVLGQLVSIALPLSIFQ